MRNTKAWSLLILLLFILSNSKAFSGEVTASKATEKENKTEQILNIDEFKKNLAEIAEKPVAKKEKMSGRVKILESDYLLSAGDTLAVSVYGEPEFSQPDILIRPDGNASIEPFGEIKAAGSTVSELTGVLTGKFKHYLLEPKVSIKVNNFKVSKVYLYGAVNRPGLYEQPKTTSTDAISGRTISQSSDMTIASVLSNSGGVKHNADLKHIKITNNSNKTTKEVDLIKLLSEGDSVQDIVLNSGDTVYVPYIASDAQISDENFAMVASSSLSPETFRVRVVGAVTRPGLYELTAHNAGVNSAIAAAEGFTTDANKKAVKIQRITPQGNISTIFANPLSGDFVLRPNDIVFVEDNNSAVAAKKFGVLGDLFFPFSRFSDAYNGWAEMFDPSRRYDWR